MHDHARRFVDYQEEFIFIGHCERNIFAGDLARNCFRGIEYDYVAWKRAVARLFPLAVDGDVAVCNQSGRLIARQVRSLGYKQIEANVAVRLDGEFLPPGSGGQFQISGRAGDTDDAGIVAGSSSPGVPG